MEVREVTAQKWCSWVLSTALLAWKVHALITVMVFSSNLEPEVVKLPRLLSIFKWEADLHFSS